MRLTPEQEAEFTFLTRHLKGLDVDGHIKVARIRCEEMEKGVKFSDPAEAIAFMKMYAPLRNIVSAAEKYSVALKEKFQLTDSQLTACSKIFKIMEASVTKQQGQTLFPSSKTIFGQQQFNQLFDKFSSSPSLTKTPRKP